MARLAAISSVSSRRARRRLVSASGEGGSDLISSLSSRVGGGRCTASARALQLPQRRPARCRGRAMAAASVLGWPEGRARATLHQLTICLSAIPRRRRRNFLPPRDCRHPLRHRYGSNDAQRALLGTVKHDFLAKLGQSSWRSEPILVAERRLLEASEHSLAPPDTPARILGICKTHTHSRMPALNRPTRAQAPSSTPTHPVAPDSTDHPPPEPPK